MLLFIAASSSHNGAIMFAKSPCVALFGCERKRHKFARRSWCGIFGSEVQWRNNSKSFVQLHRKGIALSLLLDKK